MADKKNKITYEVIRENEKINGLLEKGNSVLKEIGYTEHSKKTCGKGSSQSR